MVMAYCFKENKVSFLKVSYLVSLQSPTEDVDGDIVEPVPVVCIHDQKGSRIDCWLSNRLQVEAKIIWHKII